MKALMAVGAGFALCWYFSVELFEFAAKPITEIGGVIVIHDPTEAFNVYLKISFVAALYLAAPFVLWQVWRFIAPGLSRHERRYGGPFIISASAFFLLGGVFGYSVAFPTALKFIIHMPQGHIVPRMAAETYVNVFSTVMIMVGIFFETPPVVFILSRLGIVSGPFLLRNTGMGNVNFLGHRRRRHTSHGRLQDDGRGNSNEPFIHDRSGGCLRFWPATADYGILGGNFSMDLFCRFCLAQI